MATTLVNPCLMPAILFNGIANPKIVDSELLVNHLDKRFIVKLGVFYNDHLQRKECSDEEIIDGLTLHSYNDRLIEKRSDRHIQKPDNSILCDFYIVIRLMIQNGNVLVCSHGYHSQCL